MDRDGEHQSFRVDEQVAFATFHLLATIIAALPTDPRRLHRLAVNDAGTRLLITAQLHAQGLAQRRVDPLPGAVAAPLPQIMKAGLPEGGRSRGNKRQAQPLRTS
jgi:hypothetical protein